MRKFTALVAALALVSTASAATFTATIVLPDGATVTAGDENGLAVEVHGILDTDTDNDGLVFVSVDISAAGPEALEMGTAVAWGPPDDDSMENFVQPLGYDANYGGTPVGDDLLQSGGAQNTIGNDPNAPPNLPFPSAEFIDFGVAHSNQVILSGTITIPADFPVSAEGDTYTLSLANVLANVLGDGQAPTSFGIYDVEAAEGQSGASVDILVLPSCATPAFLAGAQGVSIGDRIYDGYIDPLRESDNGVDVNQGLDSLTVVFSTPLQNQDSSPLDASAFSIADTGGTAPNITGISTADDRVVTVNLDGHIAVQEWTTLSVSAEAICDDTLDIDSSINVGYLPADVDQNAAVTPFDLLKFRQIVNDQFDPPVGTDENFVDTDRNGNITPFDLLAFRQLINGTGNATMPWNGESLPPAP